jgi:hypothetical protein
VMRTRSVNLSHGCDGDCPKNYGGRLLPRRFGTVPRAKCRSTNR